MTLTKNLKNYKNKSMINNILKLLIAIGCTLAICYVGYTCGEIIYKSPRNWTLLDWSAFIGFYFIIIKPVCDYWNDKISNILGIPKNN